MSKKISVFIAQAKSVDYSQGSNFKTLLNLALKSAKSIILDTPENADIILFICQSI